MFCEDTNIQRQSIYIRCHRFKGRLGAPRQLWRGASSPVGTSASRFIAVLYAEAPTTEEYHSLEYGLFAPENAEALKFSKDEGNPATGSPHVL